MAEIDDNELLAIRSKILANDVIIQLLLTITRENYEESDWDTIVSAVIESVRANKDDADEELKVIWDEVEARVRARLKGDS